MSQSRRNRHAESLRVKETVVEALIGQPDAEVLDDAVRDGVSPGQAQRRVLAALHEARQRVAAPVDQAARQRQTERATRKLKGLSIDASRARAILKRVAAATSAEGIVPLPHAAQLDQVKGDAEALEMVATLKDLGVISDEDLK